jgi:glycosyltransferase involved in cell wall biosynthesis
MAELVFWLAAGALAYIWVGYPLLLALVGAVLPEPRRALGRRPRLSVVIAAHNEAEVIEAKLDSTLGQRYPRERLEVIVVSDGSTDGTDGIVLRHPDPRVVLLRQESRAGKSAALNRGVAAASGEILVFTDANALFAPEALSRLAAHLADPRVGLVSGQGLYGRAAADARVVSQGYVRYEARLRRGESALGVLAGADGAVYALRRELFRPLGSAEVNDLLHPLEAAQAGRLCRFDPHACTVEPPSRDARQEFRRHVRMIAQGIDVTVAWLPRLVASRRWAALWALLSHRVLRWLSAPLLAAVLVASLVLSGRDGLYAAALEAQALFYALALIGVLAERRGIALGPLAIPYYFCVVCVAGVAGVARWARGGAEAVWAPGGRVPAARDRAA